MLDQNDFQNLLRVVRATKPADFEQGKALVVLEGKILQTLQKAADAQVQGLVDKQIAERQDAEAAKLHEE